MTAVGERFVVCGSRPWNRRTYEQRLAAGPGGSWEFVCTPEELGQALARGPAPRFIFFLHWSWIVPADVVAANVCVVFHMTAVPFGRGGSPLQNLIARGFDRTTLSAIRMTDEVDAGPVFLTRDLSLAGTAEQVYLRADRLGADMILEIIDRDLMPHDQDGEVVHFTRRHPAESALPGDMDDLDAIDAFIRMLDAATYPKAFIDHGRLRIELTRSARYDGVVIADARISVRPSPTAAEPEVPT